MNALGIDYGERRIGLAYGDEVGVASPLRAATQPALEERLACIGDVIKERRIDRLVVGYPYNMDGSAGFKAKEVDAFVGLLQKRFGLPVHRVDETLTSVQAGSGMKKKGGRNLANAQKHRATGELDSRAAAIILQDYLDSALGLQPDEPILE
ncbi:MAG: Holliday junction resolvase RuvX [Opitutales bacterium]|jgi:putative Holliday junction resolvase